MNEPSGNLVAYFMAKNFLPGLTKTSPRRTLLEFSYNGAKVDCYGTGGPTFTPNDYGWEDTVVEIVTKALPKNSATGIAYYGALAEYRECLQRRYGIDLRYTMVGHSLGGFETMAVLDAAAEANKPWMFTNAITVDGALHPEVIVDTLKIGSCAFRAGTLKAYVGDALTELIRKYPRTGWYIQAIYAFSLISGPHWAGNIIKSAQASDTRVATVTNSLDGCLVPEATQDDEAMETPLFTVDTQGSGITQHSALLKLRQSPTDPTGYPLAAFLNRFVEPPKVPKADLAGAISAPASGLTRTAVPVASGAITGRLVEPGSVKPARGQVSVGTTATLDRTVDVAADGTFTIDDLAPGDYRVRTVPTQKGFSSAWIGGDSFATARVFAVKGSTPIGDVSGLRQNPYTVTAGFRGKAPGRSGGGPGQRQG